MENNKHGDILQADLKDTYHTLPLKTMMAYKWARDHCAHAQYYMMADADVFVDIYKVVRYLQGLKWNSDSSYALCKVEWTEMPQRPETDNKAAIPESEYSSDQYAPYCWGGLYIAPVSVINKLYLTGLHTPLIRIDDVWTGILAERAGVTFPPTSDAFILPWGTRHEMLSHIKYHDGPLMVAAYHGSKTYILDSIRDLWINLQRHRENQKEGKFKNNIYM